ncbi:MAG: hypothetical protein ACRC5H_00545 [Treponemataceae bacterium]
MIKKPIVFTIFILIIATMLNAENYFFSRHPILNIRQAAMGGSYVTNTSSFDSFFSNPAAIPLLKNQTYYSRLSLNAGGPLNELFKLSPKNFENPEALVQTVSQLLEKYNTINFDVNLTGPFVFGNIFNGFGWSISNNTYLTSAIPSLNVTDIRAGEEVSLQIGYGIPLIKTNHHLWSIGVSAKMILQSEFFYTESISNLQNSINNLTDTPFYMNVGYGFDIGTFYQFADFFSLSIVFYDVYSPVHINRLEKYKGVSSRYVTPTDMTIGVGFKLPQKLLGKIVSSWMIMADYKNMIYAFDDFQRNPLLNLSIGTELQLFKMLALRVGVSDLYLNTGLGLTFGAFNLDFAIYSKELGLEPGSNPQLNMGLSISFVY